MSCSRPRCGRRTAGPTELRVHLPAGEETVATARDLVAGRRGAARSSPSTCGHRRPGQSWTCRCRRRRPRCWTRCSSSRRPPGRRDRRERGSADRRAGRGGGGERADPALLRAAWAAGRAGPDAGRAPGVRPGDRDGAAGDKGGAAARVHPRRRRRSWWRRGGTTTGVASRTGCRSGRRRSWPRWRPSWPTSPSSATRCGLGFPS